MLNDSRAARKGMIEGQLTPNHITDTALLAVMKLVPREFFVPIAFAGSAYIDEEIPLGSGRMLMEPMVLARLIQALELKGTGRVLIIGGAYGYSAAIIAHLASEVVMVEENALIAQARTALPLLGLRNIELVESGLSAPKVDGVFDAILIEGAIQGLPELIASLLKENGKIAYVESKDLRIDGLKGAHTGLGRLAVSSKKGGLHTRYLTEAGVTLLPGFQAKMDFIFS